MMNETVELLCKVTVTTIFFQLIMLFWLIYMSINTPKTLKATKKVDLDDKSLYNIVNSLINYCVQKKDKEGAMLVTAFGKHLYDKKIKK